MAVSENELRIAVVLDASEAESGLANLNSELQGLESSGSGQIDGASDSIENLGGQSEQAGLNVSGLAKEIGGVSPEAGKAMGALDSLTASGFNPLVAVIGLAVVAIKKYAEYMAEAVEMTTAQEVELKRLEIALGETADPEIIQFYKDFAAQLQATTGYADTLTYSLISQSIQRGVDADQIEDFTTVVYNLASTYERLNEQTAAQGLATFITTGDLGMLSRANAQWQEMLDAGASVDDVLKQIAIDTKGTAAELEKVKDYSTAIENAQGDIKEARGKIWLLAKQEAGYGETINENLTRRAKILEKIGEQNQDAADKQTKAWTGIVGAVQNFWTNVLIGNQISKLYIEAMGKALGLIFTNLWEDIKGGAMVATGYVIDKLTDAVAEMLENIAYGLKDLPKVGDKIFESLNGSAEKLRETGEGLQEDGQALIDATDYSGVSAFFDDALTKSNQLLIITGDTADEAGDIDLSFQGAADSTSDMTDSLSEVSSLAGDLETRLKNAKTQYDAGVISAQEMYKIIGDAGGQIQTQIELAKEKGTLTDDEIAELQKNLDLLELINEWMISNTDEQKKTLDETDKWSDSLEGVLGQLQSVLGSLGNLAEETGITYSLAESIGTTEDAVNDVIDLTAGFAGSLANAIATGDPASIVAAVVDGTILLIRVFDRVSNTLDKIKESTAEILDDDTLSGQEKISALETQKNQLEQLLEITKRAKKRAEIEEEIKGIQEEITAEYESQWDLIQSAASVEKSQTESQISLLKRKQELLATNEEEWRAYQEKIITGLKNELDYYDKIEAEQGFLTNDQLLEIENLKLDILEAQTEEYEAQAEAVAGESDERAKYWAMEEQKYRLLLEQAQTDEERLDYQNRIIDAMKNQIAIAEEEYATAAEAGITAAEQLEYQVEILGMKNDLTEYQNSLLEKQADLTSGMTDEQRALVAALKQQIELGVLSETNIADVSGIISQLSGAGFSGLNLASQISDLGISGIAAGMSGYNTSIGAVNVYNATDEAMNTILNGTISSTI